MAEKAMKSKIINGDCIEEMKTMPDNSVDAIVTDPPYDLTSQKVYSKIKKLEDIKGKGVLKKNIEQNTAYGSLAGGFMGKKWDGTGIAFKVELWKEVLRVLKPGGHLLSFGGTRTYHRMAVAIEDAGFEIRDMLEWIYATGFPKSMNMGKAYDKKMGNEREEYVDENFLKRNPKDNTDGVYESGLKDGVEGAKKTKGTSQWEGFGTALKPAHEPIVLARKPLSEKTIVANCIKHGTGALDIDGCRIPTYAKSFEDNREDKIQQNCYGKYNKGTDYDGSKGRFPANLLVTDDALNDGEMTKSGNMNGTYKNTIMKNKAGIRDGKEIHLQQKGDSGSKSRYFDIDVWGEKHGLIQTPKASKSERNKGCEELEHKRHSDRKKDDGAGGDNPRNRTNTLKQNFHPTVKPIHLMSWLVRLVSKEGDTVLDPFIGSGTTGVSCMKLNRNFIGIEKDEDYCKIAEARLKPFMEQERLQ